MEDLQCAFLKRGGFFCAEKYKLRTFHFMHLKGGWSEEAASEECAHTEEGWPQWSVVMKSPFGVVPQSRN